MCAAKTSCEPDPRIYGYRDARQYVGDLCEWKRQQERGFSFRKLAQRSGMNSPNYVQKFIAGDRNLSPVTGAHLAMALDLDDDGQEFFLILLKLTQTANPDERKQVYANLLEAAIRHGTGKIDAARLAYFSDWFIPVVHAMASLQEFVPDATWICERISPRISADEARKALSVLSELEILVFRGPVDFELREPRLETDDGLRSIWIREYHRSMINLSLRAIDLWSPEQRTTSALTVTVPTEAIGMTLQWVDDFRKQLFDRIMALQSEMTGVPGEVVQYNFQVFPLSEQKGSRES